MNQQTKKQYLDKKLLYVQGKMTEAEMIRFFKFQDDLKTQGYEEELGILTEAVHKYVVLEQGSLA